MKNLCKYRKIGDCVKKWWTLRDSNSGRCNPRRFSRPFLERFKCIESRWKRGFALYDQVQNATNFCLVKSKVLGNVLEEWGAVLFNNFILPMLTPLIMLLNTILHQLDVV